MPLSDFVRLHDPRFKTCLDDGAELVKLWSGGKWVEGPAWFDAGYLIWSDVPNNRLYKWDEASVTVSVFRSSSAMSNGNSPTRDGRLLTCEQGSRRITRTEHDGSITVLASHFEGKKFNAPNDIVEKSDGSVWFTDPDYGPSGRAGSLELDGCHVYRVDPESGEVTQVINDMVMPNGLAFSPDERWLYVVDTGSTHFADGPNHIRRFEVGPDGNLSGGAVIARNQAKGFDGLRVDTEGRLWCGSWDGVDCLDADGVMLGQVLVPERVANLAFGGAGRNVLYMCGTTSLYACSTNVVGTP
ncbi:SMP-30/gluconolactonase/LRE family protein [Devosia rhodophyticola]|uniref:SMP-30/gluconolactonase/LRE family protein n=1 Tax=Devosia rhodophyticola TaxID=3026423 RepID=A0ABY7YVH9_9HYPH|nr:SMP-30/gluconolactonase/LRE family protein [Devosia rhodophyticola]WDR05207.1 SMP-30/gluconolactonase/LRE family protein [Devosia rhodophyticola]